VSYGNEWELAIAMLAEKSARVRRATEKLRAAEALTTVVALQDPAFLTGREAKRDEAFRAMGLYFEHDIVGGGYVGDQQRIDFQERQAAILETYVDTLLADAATRMGQFLPGAKIGKRFFVFNPLGFTRGLPAEITYPGTAPFSVFLAGTNTEVASEAVGAGSDRRIRFHASPIASIGYRLYDVRDSASALILPKTAAFAGGVLTTTRYRIRLDGRGAIQSLIELGRENREWVQPADGKGLNDLGEGSGTVVLESNGPVSATLRAEIAGPQPRTVRLTVYAGSGRIDLENRIDGNFDDTKIYSFPFAITAPLVRHEEVGAVIAAQLAPAGAYSARGQNSLYEWLTLGHFADMSSRTAKDGITLSNSDAYFMRIGNSNLHALDPATPRIDVLAGGRPNGGAFVGQGGDSHFLNRFSLLPHGAYNQASAMRFALDAQNPLVTGAVTGPVKGAKLGSLAYSLLSPTVPAALVWAVKPAEEGIGAGIIVRLWNQSTASVKAGFRLYQRYKGAGLQRTTNIETDVAADDPVAQPDAAALRGSQIGTFRIKLPK
jgi:alpha-mannosidase